MGLARIAACDPDVPLTGVYDAGSWAPLQTTIPMPACHTPHPLPPSRHLTMPARQQATVCLQTVRIRGQQTSSLTKGLRAFAFAQSIFGQAKRKLGPNCLWVLAQGRICQRIRHGQGQGRHKVQNNFCRRKPVIGA